MTSNDSEPVVCKRYRSRGGASGSEPVMPVQVSSVSPASQEHNVSLEVGVALTAKSRALEPCHHPLVVALQVLLQFMQPALQSFIPALARRKH